MLNCITGYKENVKCHFVRCLLFQQDQFDSSCCHGVSVSTESESLEFFIQAQYMSIIYHFKDPPVVFPPRLFASSLLQLEVDLHTCQLSRFSLESPSFS